MQIRKNIVLAAKLGIVPSLLPSVVTEKKDTKECYTKCDNFCGQRKGLKQFFKKRKVCWPHGLNSPQLGAIVMVHC
jgi:hypothetical protein